MIKLVFLDSGPLISLAKVDRLDILDNFNCPIIITDVVKIEVLDSPYDAIDYPILLKWFDEQKNNVQIHNTKIGKLLKKNIKRIPPNPDGTRTRIPRHMKIKNMGEISIRDLVDSLDYKLVKGNTFLIIFEDTDVPKLILNKHINLLSTWSFLEVIQNLGLIKSTNDFFIAIEKTGYNPPRDPFKQYDDSEDKFFKDMQEIIQL